MTLEPGTPSLGQKVALITGGTRGIGRAIGLALAKAGAQVVLTHRWGSVDESALREQFLSQDCLPPVIIEADVSQSEETQNLFKAIAAGDLLPHVDGLKPRVDILVSNVCAVTQGTGTRNLKARTLKQCLNYSTWPLLDYLHAANSVLGTLPRRVIAISSDGADHFYPGYDYVAVSKSALEQLCRELATELRDAGVNVNAVRSRQVKTESYEAMFTETDRARIAAFADYELAAEDVANTVLALCLGYFDALSGQVLTVDKGSAFVDNLVSKGGELLQAVGHEQ